MKLASMLSILVVALLSPAVYADELSESDRETVAYCEEQAQLAGIEDAQDKSEYIQVCAGNFGVVVGEAKTAN